MAELVDAQVSGTCEAIRGGSSPLSRTNLSSEIQVLDKGSSDQRTACLAELLNSRDKRIDLGIAGLQRQGDVAAPCRIVARLQ